MSLSVKINDLAKRAQKQKEYLSTEAATSTALVLPFLAALGYDVFNPTEVVPEYTADVGIKKGEKVDYAIMRDDVPQILIEVKCWNVDLRDAQFSQLLRYYATTPARISILTNGFDYHFYADLVKPNTMDSKPFLTFNIENLRPADLESLRAFTKEAFEVDAILDTASDLRYLNGIKARILEEMNSPSEELVRVLSVDLLDGQRFTKRIIEQFSPLVKQGFTQVLNEKIQSRLTQALAQETGSGREKEESEPTLPEGIVAIDGDIVTTEEEVAAYEIVRTFVGEVIGADRVFMRDGKSYCSVLIDDNNRRPICRFYFDRTNKFVIIFDEDKEGHKFPIEDLSDLTKLGSHFRNGATRYILTNTSSQSEPVEANHDIDTL